MAVSREFLAFPPLNPTHLGLGPHDKCSLKWFCCNVRFRGDIRVISDSVQAITARIQTFFLK